MGHPAETRKSALPVSVYGDEGTALGESTMAITWLSELGPFRKDSFASRFLYSCLPKKNYFFRGSAPEMNDLVFGGTSCIEGVFSWTVAVAVAAAEDVKSFVVGYLSRCAMHDDGFVTATPVMRHVAAFARSCSACATIEACFSLRCVDACWVCVIPRVCRFLEA